MPGKPTPSHATATTSNSSSETSKAICKAAFYYHASANRLNIKIPKLISDLFHLLPNILLLIPNSPSPKSSPKSTFAHHNPLCTLPPDSNHDGLGVFVDPVLSVLTCSPLLGLATHTKKFYWDQQETRVC